MKVFVNAAARPIRSGMAAYSADLNLAGHGPDIEEALDSLQRGVMAWCTGLARNGLLLSALKRRGLKFEDTDPQTITVDISMAPSASVL